MLRFVFLFFALTALTLSAEDEGGPPISITSPDTATTYVFNTIKNHALIWDNSTHTLLAEVTFVEEQQESLQDREDTHRFRLPGVTLDQAHGIFYATSPKGEVIPVARRKKTLFISSIEPLPNAVVRIFHWRGAVSVILEAIRPGDVAKQKQTTNPDGTHGVDLRQLLQ